MYTYNNLGKPTTVTDPMGNVTTYAYNSIGELCWWSLPSKVSSPACASPPASATVYTYDALGTRTQVKNPTGGIPVSEQANSLTAISCLAAENGCLAVDNHGDWLAYAGAGWSTPQLIDGTSSDPIALTSGTYSVK